MIDAAPAVTETAPSVAFAAHELPSFHQTVTQILAKHPTLAILDDARPVKWQPGLVVLGFDKDTRMEQAAWKRSAICEALAAVLGADLTVDLQLDQAARPADPTRWSLHESHTQASSDEKLARKREAEEHPARRLLTEAFGAVSFLSPIVVDEVS